MPITPPHSPAAERNKQPILEALRARLPERGEALEIAAGNGQHAAHFVTGLPGWHWRPSELEAEKLQWLQATREALPPEAAARLRTPLQLDVSAASWPLPEAALDLVYCANMLHIAPRACCTGLMHGAARHLRPQGLLITYGPYIVDGVETAPSNLAFDADLRARNPAWGLRRLGEIEQAATQAGLGLRERVSLPANNLLLVWCHTNTR